MKLRIKSNKYIVLAYTMYLTYCDETKKMALTSQTVRAEEKS